MKEIIINTKEEYDKVQNELLAKGYKWIDGVSVYFDLFECADGFYKMKFVIHKENKTFEWQFLSEVEKMTEGKREKCQFCENCDLGGHCIAKENYDFFECENDEHFEPIEEENK